MKSCKLELIVENRSIFRSDCSSNRQMLRLLFLNRVDIWRAITNGWNGHHAFNKYIEIRLVNMDEALA